MMLTLVCFFWTSDLSVFVYTEKPQLLIDKSRPIWLWYSDEKQEWMIINLLTAWIIICNSIVNIVEIYWYEHIWDSHYDEKLAVEGFEPSLIWSTWIAEAIVIWCSEFVIRSNALNHSAKLPSYLVLESLSGIFMSVVVMWFFVWDSGRFWDSLLENSKGIDMTLLDFLRMSIIRCSISGYCLFCLLSGARIVYSIW